MQHPYTLRHIKTFIGPDTGGFHAALYNNGQRIGEVRDSGLDIEPVLLIGVSDFQWSQLAAYAKDQMPCQAASPRPESQVECHDILDAINRSTSLFVNRLIDNYLLLNSARNQIQSGHAAFLIEAPQTPHAETGKKGWRIQVRATVNLPDNRASFIRQYPGAVLLNGMDDVKRLDWIDELNAGNPPPLPTEKKEL